MPRTCARRAPSLALASPLAQCVCCPHVPHSAAVWVATNVSAVRDEAAVKEAVPVS